MISDVALLSIFSVAFILLLLLLAIRIKEPTPHQETLFRTILSLSAAGIAATIPGLIEFSSKLYETVIRASGAIAVFALVYLVNPASTRDRKSHNPQADTEKSNFEKSLLVIDNEPAVSELLKVYFEKAGFRVVSLGLVTSREMLLRNLAQSQPHGIILDFAMSINGVQLYGWIREWRLQVPVLFYTRYANSSKHIEMMRRVGAQLEDIFEKSEVGRDSTKMLARLTELWQTESLKTP